MKAAALVLASIFLLALAGCSMRQRIELNANGSGSAAVEVVLAPLVVQYMDDILAGLGSPPAGGSPPLFDPARIRAAFAALPGVELTSLSLPARNTLALHFTFSDINRLIPGGGSGAGAAPGSEGSVGTAGSGASPAAAGVPRPLELVDNGGVKTLRLDLSRATWPAVAGLPPLANDPLLASLGPQASRHPTEAEYLSLLEYAFSDYASKQQVRRALDSSVVDVEVRVNGTILSEKGGVRSGNTVTYRLPLLEIVTLEKPIELSVSFR